MIHWVFVPRVGQQRFDKTPKQLALAVVLLFGMSGVCAEETPEPSRQPLQLSAGLLEDALLQLGQQMQVSLFFAEEAITGKQVPALEGNFWFQKPSIGCYKTPV